MHKTYVALIFIAHFGCEGQDAVRTEHPFVPSLSIHRLQAREDAGTECKGRGREGQGKETGILFFFSMFQYKMGIAVNFGRFVCLYASMVDSRGGRFLASLNPTDMPFLVAFPVGLLGFGRVRAEHCIEGGPTWQQSQLLSCMFQNPDLPVEVGISSNPHLFIAFIS